MREGLLTIHEVAEWLKVNPQTLRNCVDRGEMNATRVGRRRRVRVRQSEVERFVGLADAEAHEDAVSSLEPDATGDFRATMLDAAGKLDASPDDLAPALVAHADAARTLANALELTAAHADDASESESAAMPDGRR